MAARRVLRYPHPALKRAADPLDPRDAGLIRAVGRDLVDTMRAHPGCVGLAAPQLGELVRMVAVDVSAHPRATTSHGLLVLVNPRITRASGAEVAREGCLSIPDLTANVRRATWVAVEGFDLDGGGRAIESEGFEARCLQHELDHLDGILFLDRVDSLKTDVFRRKTYRQPPPREPGRPDPTESGR
jgi:peptide deformylase